MAIWSCDYPGCSRPSERDNGTCALCASHRCSKHLQTTFHPCPSEETQPDEYYAAYMLTKSRYLLELLSKVNTAALISRAISLRGNFYTCTIPALARDIDDASRIKLVASQMGGQNCHLDVEFDDGVVWIARIRLNQPTSPPRSVQDHIFLSEVCTMKFLQTTKVPTPKVFDFAVETSSNLVGVSYILMEKLHGSALDWNPATPKQKTKIMEQLADIFLEIAAHPLPLLGSLSFRGELGQAAVGKKVGSQEISVQEIGGFALEQLFSTPTTPLGPFSSGKEYYQALVHLNLDQISYGEITVRQVDNYLSHKWRLEMVDHLGSSDSEGFFLKHFDDKGDHILVDEDYNITGIIDWEFASTDVKDFAFGSPCMMWPVGDFYDGRNILSAEEIEFAKIFERRGQNDMAQMVLNGRKHQRFTYFLGGVSTDIEEFSSLFQGLRKAFSEDEISSYASWRDIALDKYMNEDARLRVLLKDGFD